MSFRTAIYERIPPTLLVPALYWRRRLLNRLERETPHLRKYVRKGSTALDVGAYDGLYAIEFVRAGARRVAVFEPHPYGAKRLAEAHLRRAEIHAVALSDKDGTAQLVVPSGTYGRAESKIASDSSTPSDEIHTVPIRRLDSYGFHDVSMLKIDVEGHELEVLRGARETIRESKPVLFIEVEERHHERPIGEVLREIESLGYRGSFLDPTTIPNARWRPVSEFDPRVHQIAPNGRSPTVNDFYINNFLFLPV